MFYVVDQHKSVDHAVATRSTKPLPQGGRPSVWTWGLLVLCVSIFAGERKVQACPFCDAPDLTLTQQVESASVAVLVQWVKGLPADRERGFEGSTTYEIVEILHDRSKTLEPKGTFEIARFRPGKAGDLFLLMGSVRTIIEWGSPIELTETGWQYVRQAPSTEVAMATRLEYFVKFLEFGDPVVANDAYSEFAKAPYEDVKLIRKKISPEKVRKWIEDPATPFNRLGLYGLMLGLSGTKDDAKFLEERIFAKVDPKQFRFGIEGLMTGYIMLSGPSAIDRLDKEKLKDKNQPFSEIIATMSCLRFLWSYETELVGKVRLRQSMRLFIDNPDAIDLAIPDLARWEDWEPLDRLGELYNRGEYKVPSIRRAIIKYMLAAVSMGKEAAGESEKLPDYAVRAQKVIDRIAKEDAEFFERTKRSYIQ
ncbi:MAG: hypothetical protein R3C01_08480 [Planctomycetaceae bacterium]